MTVQQFEEIRLGANGEVRLYVSGSDLYIDNLVSNNDIIMRVNDGGTMRPIMEAIGGSGIVNFPRQSAVSAYSGGGASPSHNTWTEVGSYTENTADTHSEFNATNGRYTPQEAGEYAAICRGRWQNLDAGKSYSLCAAKNGAYQYFYTARTDNAGTYGYYAPLAASLHNCNGSTDYISAMCWQDSGGAETCGGVGFAVWKVR